MSSEIKAEDDKDPPEPCLLPAKDKVELWLNRGWNLPPASWNREFPSPTRAPCGWSLSLSVSRAMRAMEEERTQSAALVKEEPVSVAAESVEALSPELEEGEVPASPPRARCITTSRPLHSLQADPEEIQLKAVVLEQQVKVLRKEKKDLLARLAETEKVVKVNSSLLNENEQLKVRLKESKKVEKMNAALLEENERLKTRVKAAKKIEKLSAVVLKENEDLQSRLKEADRSDRVEKDYSNQKWKAEVERLKEKIENQKKNLTGLQSKLMKLVPQSGNSGYRPADSTYSHARSSVEKSCPPCCPKVQELEALATRQRSRLRNQANQLTALEAAGLKARSASFSRDTYTPKIPFVSVKTELATSHVFKPPPSAETSTEETDRALQVVKKAFPMATLIMAKYDELNLILPNVQPSVKAAIAAMPPATRSLCLSQVKGTEPQVANTSSGREELDVPVQKIERSTPSAVDLTASSDGKTSSLEQSVAVVCADQPPQEQVYGPQLPPNSSASASESVHGAPPQPAVPVNAGCKAASRKRAAPQDEGGRQQTQNLERIPRFSCDIQGMKKMIVEHLNLKGRPTANDVLSS